MILIYQVISFLVFLLSIYLVITSLYLLVFAILGSFFYMERPRKAQTPKHKFCVFIASYKSEEVAIESLAAALKQDYPKSLFEVVLIADAFEKDKLASAKKLGAVVIEVAFEQSTKTKSLNAAFNALPANCADYVVILDVDNVMQNNALQAFDAALQQGSSAIQAHRTAKNLDSNIAILDAVSEEINNTIFRKGQRVVGLNSAIIGSGMVFEYQLLKQILSEVHAVGGFDKELEIQLIKRNIAVDYLDDVKVFDEKVQQSKVLENQRRRWIAAQLHYMRKYFWSGMRALFMGNWQFFFKYIQLLLLPRVLQLGLLLLLFVFSWINDLTQAIFLLYLPTWFYAVLLLVNVFLLLIAVPKFLRNKATLKALLQLPKSMLIYALILFRLKGANKTFIHTPHQKKS